MAGEVEVKSLLLKVDASVELLRKNLSDAGQTLDNFTRKGDQAAQRFDSSMKRLNSSSGQMQNGFKQLSFQLGDVAAQLGSGTSALQVFSQQGVQVVQAIGEMSGKSKGFIGFIGGPWGIALTAAVTLLATFGSKMLESADATKLAEEGADSLGRAQGVLGSIFDTTSGKIKTQNALLLANARLMASNLRAEALAARTQAEGVASSSRVSLGNVGSTSLAARFLGLSTQPIDTNVTKLLNNVKSGALSPEEALRYADTFDLRGSGVDRNTLRQAIINFASADDKERVAGLIDQSLRSGNLAPEFRSGGGGARARGRSGGGRATVRTSSGDEYDLSAAVREALNQLSPLDLPRPVDVMSERAGKIFKSAGIDADGGFGDLLKKAESYKEAMIEANAEISRDEMQRRQESVRTLAGLYTDLFRGGTKAIWRDFKELGLQVIAQLLARFTVAKLSGQSFDFGSTLASVVSNVLPGFANGGNPPVGRASIVGERGPELFVPRVPGTIIPNHRLGGASVSLVVNAPGATAETVSMIRRELAAAAPVIIQAAQRSTVQSIQRPRL